MHALREVAFSLHEKNTSLALPFHVLHVHVRERGAGSAELLDATPGMSVKLRGMHAWHGMHEQEKTQETEGN